MSSLDLQIDTSIAKKLVELWGGRVPTWEEFKQASKERRVRVNKGIASKTLETSAKLGSEPKTFWIIYGVIVPWLMCWRTAIRQGDMSGKRVSLHALGLALAKSRAS
jgi:hypothetical protein